MRISNFVVIGAGVAGLSFALRAAEYGQVTVITKGKALDSSSAKAQGGIAAVMSEQDSFEQHIADTLDAGAGLCKEEAVRTIVQEAPSAIEELLSWGVAFDQEKGGEDYELGREGGHSQRRILHAKDTTGLEISTKLLQAALNHPNITLLENHFAIDLITTAKLGLVTEDRVLGAYVLDRNTGEVEIFRSDRVMLATGGTGRVYQYTTNPDTATGDGIAMAWRAGATIANMEFVQFHPTCFYNKRAEGAESRSFLISEAVRGEGGVLIGADGQEFMQRYDTRKSLAPRDIVARAIDSEIKRTGSSCVYLDISHKPAGFIQDRFPLIYETCKKYGVDPEKEPIPVVPAAHYQCGGVVTDINGQTTLRGLFAAGETGCTGLHGANRLASNSLLECVVIAKRALDTLLIKLPLSKGIQDYPIPAWHHGDKALPDELAVIYHNWDEIRLLMQDYVSIVRSDKRLKRAAARLRMLRHEVKDFYWGFRVTPEILELRNLVAVASLIVDCATLRKESRGLHFTTDYPNLIKDSRPIKLRRW
ncbi:MAG: L-aspartate oxidase [Akkermansia sp.]